MDDNLKFSENQKVLEEIEEYYLSVLTRYIGADPLGLVENLEFHNKTWDQWYLRLSEKSKERLSIRSCKEVQR